FYQYPLKDDSLVFIELKKKLAGKGNKRRLPLTYKEALALIDHDQKPIIEDTISIQIFKEIEQYRKTRQLIPFTFIKYDRIAMVDDKSNLRVTFDEHIEYAKIATFTGFSDFKQLPQSKDLVIMEIKSL